MLKRKFLIGTLNCLTLHMYTDHEDGPCTQYIVASANCLCKTIAQTKIVCCRKSRSFPRLSHSYLSMVINKFCDFDSKHVSPLWHNLKFVQKIFWQDSIVHRTCFPINHPRILKENQIFLQNKSACLFLKKRFQIESNRNSSI